MFRCQRQDVRRRVYRCINTMEMMMKILLLTLAVLVAASYVHAASERRSYVVTHYLSREMK